MYKSPSPKNGGPLDAFATSTFRKRPSPIAFAPPVSNSLVASPSTSPRSPRVPSQRNIVASRDLVVTTVCNPEATSSSQSTIVGNQPATPNQDDDQDPLSTEIQEITARMEKEIVLSPSPPLKRSPPIFSPLLDNILCKSRDLVLQTFVPGGFGNLVVTSCRHPECIPQTQRPRHLPLPLPSLASIHPSYPTQNQILSYAHPCRIAEATMAELASLELNDLKLTFHTSFQNVETEWTYQGQKTLWEKANKARGCIAFQVSTVLGARDLTTCLQAAFRALPPTPVAILECKEQRLQIQVMRSEATRR